MDKLNFLYKRKVSIRSLIIVGDLGFLSRADFFEVF